MPDFCGLEGMKDTGGKQKQNKGHTFVYFMPGLMLLFSLLACFPQCFILKIEKQKGNEDFMFEAQAQMVCIHLNVHSLSFPPRTA